VRAAEGEISSEERAHILTALRLAKLQNPATSESLFDFIGTVLLLQDPAGLDELQRAERRDFVMRFQQLTGPVMAKGLEDTAFYRYYPLASLNDVGGNPDFTPEPFTASYRRSLNRSLRNLTAQVFRQLRERLKVLPPGVRAGVERVLSREGELLQRFSALAERQLSVRRIRGHGDFHLGQVLYTGEDFVIIDFEGEPARPLRERRIKHSPLRDVAGMLRSFHYAAYARLAGERAPATVGVEDFARLEPAARLWYLWGSAAFLSAYLDVAHPGGLLPRSRAELSFLLEILILEKAIYELGYELNHRPAWLKIPTQAVLEALEQGTTEAGRDVPARAGQDGEVK
jgi:hypothetical protein